MYVTNLRLFPNQNRSTEKKTFTQLAFHIDRRYLCGGHFFAAKTHQILRKELPVKPRSTIYPTGILITMISNKHFYPLLGLGLIAGTFVLLATQMPQQTTTDLQETKTAAIQTAVPKTESNKNSTKPSKSKKEEISMEKDHTQIIKEYQTLDAYTVVDVSDFSKEEIKELFTISKISDFLYQRIYGKSYKKDCTISLDSLRYLRLLHVDAEGNTRIGELIVNASIAKDVKTIFYKLYKHDYPIERMVLVDEYDADDNRSMADNNSSSFNYRVVEGTTHLSKHSQGLAIDLNPQYNPYIHTLNGQTVCSPENGSAYQDRTKDFMYKIDTEDYAYKLFTKYGFSWGGSWVHSKDYQHFEK